MGVLKSGEVAENWCSNWLVTLTPMDVWRSKKACSCIHAFRPCLPTLTPLLWACFFVGTGVCISTRVFSGTELTMRKMFNECLIYILDFWAGWSPDLRRFAFSRTSASFCCLMSVESSIRQLNPRRVDHCCRHFFQKFYPVHESFFGKIPFFAQILFMRHPVHETRTYSGHHTPMRGARFCPHMCNQEEHHESSQLNPSCHQCHCGVQCDVSHSQLVVELQSRMFEVTDCTGLMGDVMEPSVDALLSVENITQKQSENRRSRTQIHPYKHYPMYFLLQSNLEFWNAGTITSALHINWVHSTNTRL